MKITFILPHVKFTGGVRAIFGYADRMCVMGHDVSIVFPAVWRDIGDFEKDGISSFRKKTAQARTYLEFVLGMGKIERYPQKARLKVVPNLFPRHIPDGDMIFATAVETAEWVNSYPKIKGDKWYYILGYENWLGDERVFASWRLPLKRVTLSRHLKEVVEEKSGLNCNGPVLCGIDFNEFYPDKKIIKNSVDYINRVGMLYHLYKWKGTADGLEAFRIAKERFSQLKLILVGRDRPKRKGMSDEFEFHYNPTRESMRKIYSSCAIWMVPSWFEGFSFIPVEAMACKCAIVATNIGEVLTRGVDGQTYLLSPIKDYKAMARNLEYLVENLEKRNEVSENGYRYVQQFTWERATAELIKVINEDT